MMVKSRVILFSILFHLGVAPVFAQEGLPQDDEAWQREFRNVAGDLRCPTCTGLSVLDSDAPFSRQIKDLVEEKMREGSSKQEILSFFVERYGPWILREPPKEGFNLIAWIFPIALLLFGPFFIWFFVWRRRRLVESFGVRSVEDVLREFEHHLQRVRG